MSISFTGIPTTIRVPLFYAEFDNTRASQGPTLKIFKILVFGQKTSAGTATANVPVKVSSESQARSLFGAGSMLHLMFKKLFANNTLTEKWAMPLADNGSGVLATSTITVTGPSTAAGTIYLYIGGRLVTVAVASGDAQNTIAAAINAAVTADVNNLPVTSGVSTNVVTLTAKNKGTLGNDIDVRTNYYPESELTPAGVSLVIVQMTAGATDPTFTSAISAMGDTQYDVLVWPYSAAFTAIESELDTRFGPTRQIDGVAVSFASDTVGNLTTLGAARNSPHVVLPGLYNSPTPSYEWAAAVAGIIALYGNVDPARPFQTLEVKGCLAPALADRFIFSDRNSLLTTGIATLYFDQSGKPRLERIITTYQTNAYGDPDVSYLDLNSRLTLSYLRYDFKAKVSNRFPRHKLASDGTRFGPGQAIVTPSVARAEAVAIFRQWEELGLVENAAQFKRDLIVERDTVDVNRLNFLLPPDLVNQLIVAAAKIQFLL